MKWCGGFRNKAIKIVKLMLVLACLYNKNQPTNQPTVALFVIVIVVYTHTQISSSSIRGKWCAIPITLPNHYSNIFVSISRQFVRVIPIEHHQRKLLWFYFIILFKHPSKSIWKHNKSISYTDQIITFHLLETVEIPINAMQFAVMLFKGDFGVLLSTLFGVCNARCLSQLCTGCL